MALQEDKWVDWQGIDPELIKPTFKAHRVTGQFIQPLTWTNTVYRQGIYDAYFLMIADKNAGDFQSFMEHLIAGWWNVHDYLTTLSFACGTNKWNEHTGELSPTDIMDAWLDKAGEIVI